jgi:NTE family protein
MRFASTSAEPVKGEANALSKFGQVVLVLQGGGALGAYQAGVYQALHEAGIEPDWIIGTSIGAINASLIAGNTPEHRLQRLQEFWSSVEYSPAQKWANALPIVGQAYANYLAIAGGIRGFFEPNLRASFGEHVKLGAESAGYYSTAPLRRTLSTLVDFDQVKSGPIRLTVGAANVRTSAMRYFDSRDEDLGLDHVMASGALPPAFPAVRIGGELYWDGGILSNTPVEAVFDDNPRRNSLVFAVHVWNPNGQEPNSIHQVANRQKDLQYASRASTHINRQRQIHRLRHIIAELAARIPEHERNSQFVKDIAGYGCLTRMHVVRLLAPQIHGEDHAKDIDFSPNGIQTRWNAGRTDTQRVLSAAPWNHAADPLEGFILHEANGGVMRAASPVNQPNPIQGAIS